MIFFNKKEPKPEYYFDPQPDISTHELAVIVGRLSHWGGNMIYPESCLKRQGITDSPMFRHFKRKDK